MTLAESAKSAGLEPIARALLERLTKDWPQMDAALPMMQRAAKLRSALNMGPPPAFVSPKDKPALLPTVADIRVCDAAKWSVENRCEPPNLSWCSIGQRPVGCCPPGKSVTDVAVGLCGCAPGGSLGDGDCPVGDSELFNRDVQQRVAENRDDLMDCYRKAFLNPTDIKGSVTLEFELGPQGQTLPLGPDNSELHTSPIQLCLHRVLRGTRFPLPLDGHAEIKVALISE